MRKRAIKSVLYLHHLAVVEILLHFRFLQPTVFFQQSCNFPLKTYGLKPPAAAAR